MLSLERLYFLVFLSAETNRKWCTSLLTNPRMLKNIDPNPTNTYGAAVCYYLSNSSELTVVL